jgi:hypothetical protein
MSPDHSVLQTPTRRTPQPGQGSSLLIIGSCQGDVFIATEVLICAERLGDEDAMRAWLAQHDIHVMHPSSKTASTDKDSTKGIGS